MSAGVGVFLAVVVPGAGRVGAIEVGGVAVVAGDVPVLELHPASPRQAAASTTVANRRLVVGRPGFPAPRTPGGACPAIALDLVGRMMLSTMRDVFICLASLASCSASNVRSATQRGEATQGAVSAHLARNATISGIVRFADDRYRRSQVRGDIVILWSTG
ncbi:MAG TPA: hypothetical protein VE441_16915 [Mycobacterium sp.]|nr:hypothetical protein [Mycobacterium sp.]